MCPNIFYKHLTIIYLFIYFNITFIIFLFFLFLYTESFFSDLIKLTWLSLDVWVLLLKLLLLFVQLLLEVLEFLLVLVLLLFGDLRFRWGLQWE